MNSLCRNKHRLWQGFFLYLFALANILILTVLPG